MTSYADPAAILGMALNEGDLAHMEGQITDSIRHAVDKSEHELERLESILAQTFTKSKMKENLFSDLEKSLTVLASGNQTQTLVNELKRIEEAYRKLGETAYASIARQGGALTRHGMGLRGPNEMALRAGAWGQKSGPDMVAGFTSWQLQQAQQEREAEEARIASIRQTGHNAWRHAAVDEDLMNRSAANMATFNSGKWNNTSAKVDMIGRLSSWHQEQLHSASEAERIATIQQTGHNAWRDAHRFEQEEEDRLRIKGNRAHNTDEEKKMADWFKQRTGEAWDRNRDPYGANHKTRQEDLYKQQKNNADTEKSVHQQQQDNLREFRQQHQQEWYESRQDRRLNQRLKGALDDADFPTPVKLGWKERLFGKPMTTDQAHRFRGISQQFGYGVDDFIQSYQYGGLAGGLRGASNNLTSMAMMSIKNPYTATAAVIGISALTAALPTLVKTIWGTDTEHLKKQSDARYDSYSHAMGVADRKFGTKAAISGQTTEFTNLADEIKEDTDLRKKALDTLKSYGIKYEKNSWFNSPQNTYSTVVGGKAGAEVDAAVKWLDADTANGTSKTDKLNRLWSNITKLNESAKFEHRQEASAFSFNRSNSAEQFQATTLKDYEETLKKEAEFKKKQIAQRLGMNATQIKLEQNAVDLELHGQLAQKEKNQLTVNENNRQRASYMRNELAAASAFSDPIKGLSLALENKRVELNRRHEAGLISTADSNKLYAFQKEQTGILKDRAVRDFGIDAMGGPDALLALTNKYKDNKANLEAGMKENPADRERYQKMMASNEAGFQKQRKDLMTDMENQYKVTSPLGKVADHFAKEAEKLEQLFKNNPDMKQEEKDKLVTNLEQSFTLAKREANRPSGHEKFAGEAIVVGGEHDRMLQNRMTGTFVNNPENDYKAQSLSVFKQMATTLGKIESALAVTKLGLK